VGIDVDVNGGEEWLPEAFEARARAANRGLLVHGWAPQVSILAHGSTGALLSHCGWNSVLESLTHGVPIVGWPLSAEQFYNVKTLAEEWGVCVEVARGNLESSAVESCKVAEGIETVMGAEMRRRPGASWRGSCAHVTGALAADAVHLAGAVSDEVAWGEAAEAAPFEVEEALGVGPS
jgi:UDP:flavonoid glycosyltransferase YjiC (YdhE family)